MSEGFRFDYDPPTIRYGRECVADLGTELERRECARALVVCGSSVGATDEVIDPVRRGLGDRLVGVFDETSASKSLATAVDGAERVAEADADCIVGLGAGSSLDTAKFVSVLAGHDRPARAAAREMVAEGRASVPAGDLPPIVVVPTTLAGADLSTVAGISLTLDPNEESESGGVSDGRLMPAAAFYDPARFEHTPTSVLTASAMNGFDKGLEMIYARDHTAITDATAVRGLRLLRRSLPTLGSTDEPAAVDEIVEGILLVQYGLSTADTYRASLIHAFGHGFSRRYDVPQGVVHAILAPHVLASLFDAVDGRRDLLAGAFDVETAGRSADAVADEIVDAVRSVRDAMGLPTQLRSIAGLERSHVPAIVDAILADSFLANVPHDLDPDRDDIEAVIEEAW